MTIVVLCLAIIIAAYAWRASHVPIKHRWRRQQARIMSDALCSRDRNQSPALIYARLRAMDAPAFEELLLESFERRGHCVVRNRRYTGDGDIDGQVVIDGRIWLIQAKRYASAIRRERVEAFASLCAARGTLGLFIHTGRTGGGSREVVDQHVRIEIASVRRLLALVPGGTITVGGRRYETQSSLDLRYIDHGHGGSPQGDDDAHREDIARGSRRRQDGDRVPAVP